MRDLATFLGVAALALVVLPLFPDLATGALFADLVVCLAPDLFDACLLLALVFFAASLLEVFLSFWLVFPGDLAVCLLSATWSGGDVLGTSSISRPPCPAGTSSVVPPPSLVLPFMPLMRSRSLTDTPNRGATLLSFSPFLSV